MFCFTLYCSLTPPRRNRVTRIVYLENVSTDPASVIVDGLETSASIAKEGSSKWRCTTSYLICDQHQIDAVSLF